MPRYESSDVAHTASTDHRIVLRPSKRPRPPADFDWALVVDFYQDRFPKGDPEAERTLGLGLVKMMHAGMLSPQRQGERAVRLLESALTSFPQDAELRVTKAEVLLLMGRHSEALSEARSAAVKLPGNWRLLACAAGAAQGEGKTDLAIDYWRQAVEVNPQMADYQAKLLTLLLRTEQLAEAQARCDKLLRLDPFNVAGRQARVDFLLRDGQKAEARREFDIIRRLRPPDLAQREQWFAEKMKDER
jgi:tetratricopeptide (TPR) repeat protein